MKKFANESATVTNFCERLWKADIAINGAGSSDGTPRVMNTVLLETFDILLSPRQPVHGSSSTR